MPYDADGQEVICCDACHRHTYPSDEIWSLCMRCYRSLPAKMRDAIESLPTPTAPEDEERAIGMAHEAVLWAQGERESAVDHALDAAKDERATSHARWLKELNTP